jgi:hypothetical protein
VRLYGANLFPDMTNDPVRAVAGLRAEMRKVARALAQKL